MIWVSRLRGGLWFGLRNQEEDKDGFQGPRREQRLSTKLKRLKETTTTSFITINLTGQLMLSCYVILSYWHYLFVTNKFPS